MREMKSPEERALSMAKAASLSQAQLELIQMSMHMVELTLDRAGPNQLLLVTKQVSLQLLGGDRAPQMLAMVYNAFILVTTD